MPVMNFDLEDGLPPVSFSLKATDAERFVAFMAECDAALKAAAAPAAVQGEPEAWKITFKDSSESIKDKYYSIHHYVAAGCVATPLYAAATVQVDEFADTHRNAPDEIRNLHKQVAAQETWKILPSQSGKTRYACPACLGAPAKPSAAFFNTGEDWTQHYQAEVVMQCQVCGGGGIVTAAISQRYFIGRAHRQDRAHRGENMRNAAQRLGVTVPQLSAWELGYSDLPTGEALQEPVSPLTQPGN